MHPEATTTDQLATTTTTEEVVTTVTTEEVVTTVTTEEVVTTATTEGPHMVATENHLTTLCTKCSSKLSFRGSILCSEIKKIYQLQVILCNYCINILSISNFSFNIFFLIFF